MRNRYLVKYDRIVKVSVVGKNVNRYIARVVKEHIHIIQLIPVSYRCVHLIMKFSEYQKLKNIKSVLYQVTILSYMGSLKVKKKFKSNLILLFFLLLGLLGLIFLSHVIFSVDVVHQNREIRDLIRDELRKENVATFQFKKTYDELEDIEERILNRNKDRLEWIEIVAYGTKYIVHVEERKINQEKEISGYQNIVSRKEGVIVSIQAKSGEKVKFVHDYVKKGDIIIAGYVTLPNNSRVPAPAIGEVLGEVWYLVKIDYPFIYQETKVTGKSKTVYSICFLNKRFGLFDFHEYHTYSFKNRVLFSSFIPFVSFVRERQYETVVYDEVYTEDMVKGKTFEYVSDKLKKDNSFIKEISDIRILSSSSDEDSIQFQLFVKAIENIGVAVPLDVNSLSHGEEMNS